MEDISRMAGRVFGSLKEGFVHIHVGYMYGMMDFGSIWPIPRAKVPVQCRMPNTHVWVTFKITANPKYEILEVIKMSAADLELYHIDVIRSTRYLH